MAEPLTPPALALSVRQPWAWALFHGKHVENRSGGALRHFKARPRVRLMIHASGGMTRDEYESALLTFQDAANAKQLTVPIGDVPKPCDLVRGAIIGSVVWVDTITRSTSPWFVGPKGMVFEYATLLAKPIPCLGELGLFDWQAPRCYERVLNRNTMRETREPAAIEKPKPWMVAWPGHAKTHPRAEPAKAAAPAPLFDPAEFEPRAPIDARTTPEELKGGGERGYITRKGS